MAWMPAIPAEEYKNYFSATELSAFMSKGPEDITRVCTKIAMDPNDVLRICYRPTTRRTIGAPEAMFHLDDILQYGPKHGLAVTRAWVEDMIELSGKKNRRWKRCAVKI